MTKAHKKIILSLVLILLSPQQLMADIAMQMHHETSNQTIMPSHSNDHMDVHAEVDQQVNEHSMPVMQQHTEHTEDHAIPCGGDCCVAMMAYPLLTLNVEFSVPVWAYGFSTASPEVYPMPRFRPPIPS